MQHLTPEELLLLLQLEGETQKNAVVLAAGHPMDSRLPVAGPLSRDISAPKPTSLPTGSGELPSSGAKAKEVIKAKPRATKLETKEIHKRYRERLKKKEDGIKQECARLVEEIANAKREQVQLQYENTVLESMCRYSESALTVVRNAASSISTLATASVFQIQEAARDGMMGFCKEVVESVWMRFIRPSDDQLLKMIRSEGHINAMRTSFINRLFVVLTEWQHASPAGRQLLECKLSYAFETRARVCKLLLCEKPGKMEALFNSTPLSQPDTSTMMLHERIRTQIICNDELIAATALTEEQRIALQRHWKIYLAHFNKTKAVVDQSILDLEKNLESSNQGALPHEPIGSLSQAAKAHLELKESSASLNNKLSKDEIIARMNLSLGGLAVLRPIQQAFLMIDSVPKSDVVMDVVECYKSVLRMEGAASKWSLKHDY